MDEKVSLAEMVPWLTIGGAGMIGRLMYHAKQVQAGKRKPLSWVLVWDIPIALGMGWIALGVGAYFKLPWEVTVSIGLTFSYLGPYGIDTTFAAYADRFKGKEESNVDV